MTIDISTRLRRFAPARMLVAGLLGLGIAACGAGGGAADDSDGPASVSADAFAGLPEVPTYNADVLPIVAEHCARCHHPRGSGPFSVFDYEAMRERADRVLAHTQSGYMPPFPPETDVVRFRNERRLPAVGREVIRRWVMAGTPEGDPAEKPPLLSFADGWDLGPPDLIVEAPEAFILPAEGQDVYRNLVIPVAVSETKYVRSIDIKPGDAKIVHHGFLNVDQTGAARVEDARTPEPGFPGMGLGGAHPPDEQMIGWTPGKAPFPGDPETTWRLEPGMDLVLQLHMLPTGEPHAIRPQIGLYFADRPGTRQSMVLRLARYDIDIPPGVREHRVEDRFELPVDVEVLSVYPHAHYLGRDLHGYAILPDGERQELVRIREWSFKWQDQYHYAEPIRLPAGSTIVMDYVFDNSGFNPDNPHDPPQRVISGLGSMDEMSELILQVRTADEADRWRLVEARAAYNLERDPTAAYAAYNMGVAAEKRGDKDAALVYYQRAIDGNPMHVGAWHNSGAILLDQGRTEEAAGRFMRTLELAPRTAEAYYALGLILEQRGRTEDAIGYYLKAVEFKPGFAQAYHGLGNALYSAERYESAIGAYQRALENDPERLGAYNGIGNALLQSGRPAEAIPFYQQVLRRNPNDPYARNNIEIARQQTTAGN